MGRRRLRRQQPDQPAASPLYIPSYIGKQYSDYTSRLYRGGTGELLDAFVFGRFDLGEVPTTVKLGRHTLYWGESLFLGGNINSIAYAQNPLDLQKGFATPGVEAKELFRPLNQISAQAAVSDTLTLSAQYFLEWESFRYPEGGTYLGPVDFAFNGPDRQFISPALGFAPARRCVRAQADTATSAWRHAGVPRGSTARSASTTATSPTSCRRPSSPRSAPGSARYNLIYADNINLYGISLAKNIARHQRRRRNVVPPATRR